MSATPPCFRTLDRPGPGLATIAEPDGRVVLWSLNRPAIRPRPCAQCGTIAGRNYRLSDAYRRGARVPRLCRPCVERDSALRDGGEGLPTHAQLVTDAQSER